MIIPPSVVVTNVPAEEDCHTRLFDNGPFILDTDTNVSIQMNNAATNNDVAIRADGHHQHSDDGEVTLVPGEEEEERRKGRRRGGSNGMVV